jgi:hypothetical protein
MAVEQAGKFLSCLAQATNFSDFAFQVEMTIIQVNGGGLVFRSSSSGNDRFQVNANGYYGPGGTDTGSFLDLNGSSINTGYSQINLLTVIAQGHNIYLYVNKKAVMYSNNSTLLGGQIGFFTVDGDSEVTGIYFRNAKVWQI